MDTVVRKKVVAGAVTAMVLVAGADGWRATSKDGPRRIPRVPVVRVRRKPKYPFGPNRDTARFVTNFKSEPGTRARSVEFLAPVARRTHLMLSSSATQGEALTVSISEKPTRVAEDGDTGTVEVGFANTTEAAEAAEFSVASAIGASISDWSHKLQAKFSVQS